MTSISCFSPNAYQNGKSDPLINSYYPSTIKPITHRETEILQWAEKLHFNATFPYLHLTDLIIHSPNPIERYINESVDIILSQTSASLQIPLRRFFYYNEQAQFDPDFMKTSQGLYFFKAQPLANGHFLVVIDAEITKLPILLKLFKMMAIIELRGWSLALGETFNGDIKNLFPVIDLLNKINVALQIKNLLGIMNYSYLVQELNHSQIPTNYKTLLFWNLLTKNYLNAQVTVWHTIYPELQFTQINKWINNITIINERRAETIKSLETFLTPLYLKIQEDVALKSQTQSPFIIAQQAKKAGDTLSKRVAAKRVLQLTTSNQCSDLFSSELPDHK